MSEEEIDTLPLNYIWALQRRRDLERFYSDLRTAQTAAILASVHRAKGAAPASPLDFVTVPCGQDEQSHQLTDEQIATIFHAMAGVPTKQN